MSHDSLTKRDSLKVLMMYNEAYHNFDVSRFMQCIVQVVPAFLRVASNVEVCITIQVSSTHCIRGAVSIPRELVRSTFLLVPMCSVSLLCVERFVVHAFGG